MSNFMRSEQERKECVFGGTSCSVGAISCVLVSCVPLRKNQWNLWMGLFMPPILLPFPLAEINTERMGTDGNERIKMQRYSHRLLSAGSFSAQSSASHKPKGEKVA